MRPFDVIAPEPGRGLALTQPSGGEAVFSEPWEAQAFALAVQLHERGAFTWTEWAEALAAEIGGGGGRRPYYECWLAALERLCLDRALVASDGLSDRARAWEDAYRRTPHGRAVELVRE